MFGVLAVALILMTYVPLFAQGRFLIWLVVFYLFTLTLEMTLLLPDGQPRQQPLIVDSVPVASRSSRTPGSGTFGNGCERRPC